MSPTPRTGLAVTTPTDTTIVLTRTFAAPRALVWEAMFTPDRMRRWMLPPPGLTLTACECVPRVGGRVKLAWKSAEADPAMTLEGEFTEVAPHDHIVHTEAIRLPNGQVISSLVERHEFTEANGITSMRITQTYASKAARDEAVSSGMDEGMEACYQALDAVLGK